MNILGLFEKVVATDSSTFVHLPFTLKTVIHCRKANILKYMYLSKVQLKRREHLIHCSPQSSGFAISLISSNSCVIVYAQLELDHLLFSTEQGHVHGAGVQYVTLVSVSGVV